MEDMENNNLQQETTPEVVSIQAQQSTKTVGIIINLDKVGKIILIATLVIFLALLIPGIVLSVPEKSSSGKGTTESYYTINVGTVYTQNTDEIEDYYYKVTVTNVQDTRLYILIDGGEIYSIKEGSKGGSQMKLYAYSSYTGYEEATYFYPEDGETYYLRIRADANSTLKVKLTYYV